MDIVLISPVAFGQPHDGHQQAVLSDVYALLDNGLRVGFVGFTYEGKAPGSMGLSPSLLLHARRGSFAVRFARGIFGGYPPSAERLYGSEAHVAVREFLNKTRPRIVIIDDVSVSGYIPLVRDLLPASKVILRSHNVMQDVRRVHLNRSHGPLKAAIKLDCNRYIEMEKKAVDGADDHWAITLSDAARMTELYGRPTRYLPVSIDIERYRSVSLDSGRVNGFVHIGTIDYRRQADFSRFLDVSWPKVLQADPGSTLLLAGQVPAALMPRTNVRCLGRVRDDAEVYAAGRFAVNFQKSTGGVKLKTLTSLAAGRVLLSTPEGVEGLPLTSGEHYWDMESTLVNGHLKTIMNDPDGARAISLAGRQYVEQNHSRASIASQVRHLLN